jgi:hypothetical protein
MGYVMDRVRTAPPREHVMRIRLTAVERLRIREIALREQRSVSDVVRTAIQQYGTEAAAR